MSLRMRVSRPYAIPGSCCTVTIFSQPNPGIDFKAKSLIITLLGVSKTRIITGDGPNEETHESSATFLEISKQIYSGPMLLEDGHVSRFHFQFPDDPILTYYHPDDMDWFRDRDAPKPQSLPPSGDYGSGNTIVYSFDVCLVDEISDSEIKASTKVNFTPTREPEVSHPQSVTSVKEIELLAGPDSPLDASSLKLALASPQFIIQDQTFPLKLYSLHEVQAAYLSSLHPPTILLKSALTQLLVNTSIQSGDNTREHRMDRRTVVNFSSTDSNAEAPYITMQELDLGALFQSLSISSVFASSFASPNIQRTYGLEILLVVESGGKTYDVVFKLGEVTLLGAELGGVGREREVKDSYDPSIDGTTVFVDNVPHKGFSGLGIESSKDE